MSVHTEQRVDPSRPRRRSAAVPHPTRAERVARGKAARQEVSLESPRSSCRARRGRIWWTCSSGRRRRGFPSWCRSVTAGCWCRRSPSSGAPRCLMAADLRGGRPRAEVQLCGDAHLSNFGVFASPERRLVFDLNDFDETLPGPFEWDVKRLAASFAVAGAGQRLQREGAPQASWRQPSPATGRR